MASESLLQAIAKYDAANTKRYGVKLNLHHDADIIMLLDSMPKKQSLIKKLLREYIVAHRPGVTDEMFEIHAALKEERKQRGIIDD